MKKSLIALAALATVATAAQAQSSVTIYGIVDAAVITARGHTSGTQTALVSGGASASRFGFRGSEDLGGGLTAGFNLESEINLGTGANGGASFYGTTSATNMFNRAAFVSLGSSNFGTLSLGRVNRLDYATTAAFDAFAGGNIVGLVRSGYLGSTDTPNAVSISGTTGHQDARYSQAVQFTTKSFNGLTLSVQRKLGGVAGDSDAASSNAFAARYASGNLDLAATYHDDKKDDGSDASETTGLYAAYNFGFAKATLVRLSKKIAGDSTKPTVTFAGAIIPVNAKVTVLTTVGRIQDAQNIDEAKTNVFGLGVNYDLSKRTTAYIHHGSAKNEGTSNYNYVSNLATAPNAAGATHRVTGAGIRHSF